MTPGRTGPDQCGDEHLTGCMIRAGSYRLASGNAAETNCWSVTSRGVTV